ncbi:efflux RND transporter permease subunit [Aestuariibacter sp. A3R04]|uniref:efflux RND transporter permease subunit n=1 Tax=Aestuariibacter sp. A3R04 TaxID=2841571 RepID=UPI001C0A0FDB|nr:efflux RND transporter permease subunit [Aestuariibacter sp. A3R04]MBU3022740.1 efflux RND transporter permease subunit [Aestuariibacter sp. A3R04]
MSIVQLAVKRPVAIAMFTVAVLLFGMVSLSRLSVNLLPELSYPTLTVRTDYNGAAPNEVEQLVSKPVEEAVGVVKGVKSVKSVSRPGQSDVILQFSWGTDMDFASLEVREKLDILQLPLDVEKPRLLKFNPSMDPVMKLGLSLTPDATQNTTDNTVAELKRLRLYAEEQIKRRLESIEGVASVRLGGGLENEILIAVDHRKASQVNVQISDIIARLQEENVNTAGGRIDAGTEAFLVRTLNEFEHLKDIENVYIRQFDGRNVQLKDVATVSNFYKDRDAITRFNGVEGTEIAIYKEGDANSVDVAQRVSERLGDINASLPDRYILDTIYNQSIFIKQAIDDVKVSALVGGLLAMLVIYLFLRNFWTTLIISISIPVSVIATFNLMYGNDISLNIMSLGGIALAVGLLVDNSIVVLENIDRHRKNHSVSNAQAAEKGTREVAGAIVASTLTTMAVFVPLIFVEGIAGQLFSDQAMTVSFALAASLIVALTVIPSLAARSKKAELAHADVFSKAKHRPTTILGWTGAVLFFPFKLIFVFMPAALITLVIGVWAIMAKLCGFIFRPMSLGVSALFIRLQSGYDSAIRLALGQRTVVLFTALIITGSSVLLVPKLGMELIPKLSQGEFFVEVTLPSGSRVERTDRLLAELAKVTNAQPGVQRTYSLAGTGSLLSAAPSQGGDHWGKLNVVMKPGTDLALMNNAKDAMRAFLRNQAGVQSQFGEPALFSFSAPLQIQLQGYDLSQLRLYSQQIISELESNQRFADITSTLQAGNPELKIRFNHAKLARLNLDAKQVADIVASQIGGSIATQYSIDDRKVDILVRSKEQQRDNIADVSAIIVNPQSQFPVPLGAVADIYMSTGPSEITRVSQQRVVLIEANLAYGDLADAVADAEKALGAVSLPLSMKSAVAGQREDMDESFASLQFALALAVFMVYLVMASQFESLLHPLLILFAVPLAGAGSVFGLWITGTHVSVVVFIGLIMLCGIVVNNAIVLIDRINQLRAHGMDKSQAIVEAAKSRLRPIVMTTLTTILGLLPMAIGFGDGAEVRTPMAITVIFGLLFATLLTLIVLPVLYSVFDNKTFVRETEADVLSGQGENHYG